jgi:hypothetical protein
VGWISWLESGLATLQVIPAKAGMTNCFFHDL